MIVDRDVSGLRQVNEENVSDFITEKIGVQVTFLFLEVLFR